jgi:hypothetical protein
VTAPARQGKHGTLHLYRIAYHDSIDSGSPPDVSSVWAFSSSHAIEKWEESNEDQGFGSLVMDSIKRVTREIEV